MMHLPVRLFLLTLFLKWVNDWPVMGAAGEPVMTHRKPNISRTYSISTPADSDEFNDHRLNLQWQWAANPQSNWAFPAGAYGFLRLLNVPSPNDAKNFWDVPNLFLQKFPAPSFTATAKVTFTARNEGERTGLIVTGLDYAYAAVEKKKDGLYISQIVCQNADKGSTETETAGGKLDGNTFWLRVRVQENAVCSFSFSVNGKTFVPLGPQFQARQGRWIGAKVGIFAVGKGPAPEMGYAGYDWFRVE
jgi:beta-xylosidase